MIRPSSSIGASVALIGLAILLAILPGCHHMLCSDRVGQSVVSPDGRYVASVLQSDCGAREHATVVELRRNRFLLKDRRIVFLIGGFQTVGVAWSAKSQLAIVSPTCESKKIELRNWKNDVTVRCEVAATAGIASGR
jgi:hypothetical protein